MRTGLGRTTTSYCLNDLDHTHTGNRQLRELTGTPSELDIINIATGLYSNRCTLRDAYKIIRGDGEILIQPPFPYIECWRWLQEAKQDSRTTSQHAKVFEHLEQPVLVSAVSGGQSEIPSTSSSKRPNGSEPVSPEQIPSLRVRRGGSKKALQLEKGQRALQIGARGISQLAETSRKKARS